MAKADPGAEDHLIASPLKAEEPPYRVLSPGVAAQGTGRRRPFQMGGDSAVGCDRNQSASNLRRVHAECAKKYCRGVG
jgi:hypothetical protein